MFYNSITQRNCFKQRHGHIIKTIFIWSSQFTKTQKTKWNVIKAIIIMLHLSCTRMKEVIYFLQFACTPIFKFHTFEQIHKQRMFLCAIVHQLNGIIHWRQNNIVLGQNDIEQKRIIVLAPPLWLAVGIRSL